MSYMKQTEPWLGALLGWLIENHGEENAVESCIAELKKKLLESYRNGQRDCLKCNPKPKRSAPPER